MQTVSRLITEFIPTSYQLSLDIDRIGRTFKGTMTIKGSSVNGKVVLHSKGLVLDTVLIDGKEASHALGINDEVELTHPALAPGEHIVVLGYNGTITDQLHGLYPCRFVHNGEPKELLVTQFESHHAREMMPCIDEPEAKATFDVTVTTETSITVLGNMPITSQTEAAGRMVTKFATTPRMSTYLLALVMGEMHSKTAKTADGVDVSVWATPAQSPESLDFALEHAVKTIEFFNDYFGVPYPLPKSDHVAVPDFSSGAMENWGLITYREVALLAEPQTTSISSKQYIAMVVAHELSHQWFGNLVTMKWWNNLWLNESFATIMEYLAVDALHPEWNEWFEFSSSEGVMALRRDSIDGVQSVQTDVHHPDEISSLFDGAIVYAKGGRLLRMMQTYIGEAAFRTGLKSYFIKHQYGNTTGDDLWAELSEASGKDVGQLMNTWISQSGFPVVHASLNDSTLTLTQERFFVGPHDASEQLWPIPLRANRTDIPTLFEEKSVSIPFVDTEVLHLNMDDSAHFITNYGANLKSRLVEEVRSGAMNEVQRAQFLHEQTLLARAGYIGSAELIPLLDAYRNESNEKVWDTIALAISDLKKFVEYDQYAESHLRSFVAGLARMQFDRLGWDKRAEESEDDTKLRATIIGCMLYGEVSDVIDHAITMYRTTDMDSFDPELRGLILGAAVRHGADGQIIDDLMKLYASTASADLQGDITAAVTSSKDLAILTRLLNQLKDTQTIRTQDTVRWYVNLLRNREGREATWQWVREQWPWIEETFASDKSHDYFPRYSASILSARKHLDEYRSFFTPLRSNPGLTRVIDMGILDLEGRIELIERDGKAVAEALSDF